MWKAYTTSGNSLDPELRTALGSACADDSCHDGGEGYAQRHLQQSDYYDQNRTVEGKWHGRGAELLGLKGEVTSEDFEAVRQISTHKRENSSGNVTGQIALPAMVIRNASETSTLGICRVAAKEIGIVGHFGWHTFRHTYATLLKGNGEDVKVVQELMRHANISVTLNIYAQAITQPSEMRRAEL